jgi:hypothetical protein
VNPSGKIASGRSDAPGRRCERMVQIRVVFGQKRPRLRRSLDFGRIWRRAR